MFTSYLIDPGEGYITKNCAADKTKIWLMLITQVFVSCL